MSCFCRWDYHGGCFLYARHRQGEHPRSLSQCLHLSRCPTPSMHAPCSGCKGLCPGPDVCLSSVEQESPRSLEYRITAPRGSDCTRALTDDPCSTQSLSAAPNLASATGPGTSWAGRCSHPKSQTQHTGPCGGGKRRGISTGWWHRMWMLFIPKPGIKGLLSSMAAPTGAEAIF